MKHPHGTRQAYTFDRCRCETCTFESTRYERRRRYYRHIGQPYTVPATGFARRVRALMAIGYTMRQISAELGMANGNLSSKLHKNGTVQRATHERMVALYARWHMLPQSGMQADRTKRMATRRGWAPPLAWEDIDADPKPSGVRADGPSKRPKGFRTDDRECPRCGIRQ